MYKGSITFNKTVKKILEDFNIYPRAQAPIANGPNIDFTGPAPTGFLGGGLPGINPGRNKIVKVKKRKKIKKKN